MGDGKGGGVTGKGHSASRNAGGAAYYRDDVNSRPREAYGEAEQRGPPPLVLAVVLLPPPKLHTSTL